MLELAEQSTLAGDELMDMLGRASIEAVLRSSTERIGSPLNLRKKGRAVGWHGNETGTAALVNRKLRVRWPRLRKMQGSQEGEVPVPACAATRREGKLRSRMLEILLRGVSTRQ